MAMKGNQNNLDQSKDILDIKDRSILSPHVPSDFLAIVYYNPDTWEQLWLRRQLSRAPRFAQCWRKEGRLNITKGGVGSWAKEAVFAILMLLFAQTSSIATTV